MLQSLKNFYHFLQALLASVYYGFPSHRLKVIGVTGTDGKTTTTHLIYHILKSAGKKVSMISSIYASVAGKTYNTGFHVTTPDVFPLHKFLKQSVDAGDEYFVLETTSHSLDQNRVALIKYEVGVITNVTHEHLDYHKQYAEYIKSKSKLFERAMIRIINKDDRSYEQLLQILRVRDSFTANPQGLQARKYYTYSLKNKADYSLDIEKKLNLNIAQFNNYNFLAAYAVCDLLGIDSNNILSALKSFKLPKGRLEVILQKPFVLIIDFAHTPNALHHALSEVRERYLLKGKRLIHVFGAAGKRDSSKRVLMGKESGEFSDIVILTEEDYRDEDPQKICAQVAKGLESEGLTYLVNDRVVDTSRNVYSIIIDRGKAIEKAVQIAKPGDVVILTGKGHEKSLARGKKECPWNEYEAVNHAIDLKKDNLI